MCVFCDVEVPRIASPHHPKKVSVPTVCIAMVASNDPVELYYAPTPNGWKVTILLEEAGIPYVVHPLDLSAGDQHSEEFLRLCPNGRIPCAVFREGGKSYSVFESGAIMWHLAVTDPRAARFWPRDAWGRTCAVQWLFWVNAGLGPMAGQLSHFFYYAPHVAPDADHSYAKDRYSREHFLSSRREVLDSSFRGQVGEPMPGCIEANCSEIGTFVHTSTTCTHIYAISRCFDFFPTQQLR